MSSENILAIQTEWRKLFGEIGIAWQNTTPKMVAGLARP